jgi:hypothetical protein
MRGEAEMKRIAVLAGALALLGALGGCAGVKAGDGNLTDDWAVHAAPKVPEPAAGSCWTTTATEVSDLASVGFTQAPCDMSHTFETVKIGHFTGADAEHHLPPAPSAMTAAWADCDKAAGEFLGGEWQAGRVNVVVAPPTSRQWNGGARFYRCDVAALRSEAGVFEPRRTTLKGTVAEGGELRLGCGVQVGMTADTWDDITPAKCTDPHDVEFAGTISSASADYPKDSKAVDAAFDKPCEAKMLAYTGMSRSHWNAQRALFYGYWMTGSTEDWAAGNHSARCYLMIDKKKINRSLKGAGNVSV